MDSTTRKSLIFTSLCKWECHKYNEHEPEGTVSKIHPDLGPSHPCLPVEISMLKPDQASCSSCVQPPVLWAKINFCFPIEVVIMSRLTQAWVICGWYVTAVYNTWIYKKNGLQPVKATLKGV